MKIGIFGGCFNPPHNMHKKITIDLINKKYLDKVIYVPTGNNYNKNDLIDFIDRYNMLKLIINNDNLLVSDIQNNPNYKYTYQILDYFKTIYKEADLYFICGTDNLKELELWKNYKYILENYKLLVIKRNNDDIENILNKYKKYKENIIITTLSEKDISSTIIRNLIQERKNDIIKNNLEPKVLKYIKSKKLYGGI